MTRKYVLDTNIFSYIAKGNSKAARAEFQRLSQSREAAVCISAVTEAEVRYGMAKHVLSPVRCAAIEGLLAALQILDWSSAEAAAYAELRAKLEAVGITVSAMDLFIAAQAIAAKAVLVSGDKVFKAVADTVGLPITNWAVDVQGIE